MRGYGQFCPVAKACEIFGERWTPLILRELIFGSILIRGHSTAAAETIQHTLHQSLRTFEKRRQQVYERMEAKREAKKGQNQ